MSRPTQDQWNRHKSYGGQSLYVPVNVWGSASLYLAVGCMPREDYTLAPLPLLPPTTPEAAAAAAATGALTTIESQQHDVQKRFHEKTLLEAKMYPYRYCPAVPDARLQPHLMRDNPQIGLTPDRAAAVARNLRRTLFSNALREMTVLEAANHTAPAPAQPAAPGGTPAAPVVAVPTTSSGSGGSSSSSSSSVGPRRCTSSVLLHVGEFGATSADVPTVDADRHAAAAAPVALAPGGAAATPQYPLPALSAAARWAHSAIPWGFFQRNSSLIASERWTVRRCDTSTHVYRVNYFQSNDGNGYFAKVVPTDARGALHFLYLKWKGYL